MKNQVCFQTFKRNIYMIKIVANAALTTCFVIYVFLIVYSSLAVSVISWDPDAWNWNSREGSRLRKRQNQSSQIPESRAVYQHLVH